MRRPAAAKVAALAGSAALACITGAVVALADPGSGNGGNPCSHGSAGQHNPHCTGQPPGHGGGGGGGGGNPGPVPSPAALAFGYSIDDGTVSAAAGSPANDDWSGAFVTPGLTDGDATQAGFWFQLACLAAGNEVVCPGLQWATVTHVGDFNGVDTSQGSVGSEAWAGGGQPGALVSAATGEGAVSVNVWTAGGEPGASVTGQVEGHPVP
jgi:hypothetical protein